MTRTDDVTFTDDTGDVSQVPSLTDLEPRASIRDLYATNVPMVVFLLAAGAAYGVAAGVFFDVGVFTRVAVGVFAACLPLLAWTDLRTFRLPNKIVGPAALVMSVGVLVDVVAGNMPWQTAATALGVGVVLGVLFLVLAVVSGGGLGMGDIKFVTLAASVVALQSTLDAAIALVIVPPALALVALLPVLLKFVMVRGSDEGSTGMLGKYKFAYGPYLVAGAVLGLLLPAETLTSLFL